MANTKSRKHNKKTLKKSMNKKHKQSRKKTNTKKISLTKHRAEFKKALRLNLAGRLHEVGVAMAGGGRSKCETIAATGLMRGISRSRGIARSRAIAIAGGNSNIGYKKMTDGMVSSPVTAASLMRGISRSRGIARSRAIAIAGGNSNIGYKKMTGGMVSSPAAGPVGNPWEGGNYVTPTPNFFAYSPNGIAVGGTELARSTKDDFIMNPPMNGGKKRKGHKGQKGGFFQEIVNLGRGAQYGVNGGYFDLTGKQQPLSQNPYPTTQPFSNSDSSSTSIVQSMAPDVKQLYINANNQVLSA